MKLSELLLEKFFNAFTLEDKSRYADEVWDMLQKSYAPIGGIKGSGFSSKEEMIKTIPMIKVGLRNKKPVMAMLYKDKVGRKRVAIATDGSKEEKELLKMALIEEAKTNRAFGEVSGPSWGFIQKIMGPNELKRILIKPEQVQKILKSDEIIPEPGTDIKVRDNDPYKDYYYQHKIGDKFHTKIMLGTPHIPIKR